MGGSVVRSAVLGDTGRGEEGEEAVEGICIALKLLTLSLMTG